MTVKELIEWVMRAQDYYDNEQSVDDIEKKKASFSRDCLRNTSYEYNEIEFQLAEILFNEHGYSIQDWVKL